MERHKSLWDYAREIRRDWKNPYFGAVPYISAMTQIDQLEDRYIAETGCDIVPYFLSNASSWRGDVARKIKTELKALTKKHCGW